MALANCGLCGLRALCEILCALRALCGHCAFTIAYVLKTCYFIK
jgi:hypothetical protein